MKRHFGIGILRPLGKLTFAFIVTAAAIAALSFEARAVNVQTTYRIINNGKADFGSGIHQLGGPGNNATITYDWTTASTGLMGVTARVRGTLYYDSLSGPGCARLTIRFRDEDIVNLDLRTITVCGPGGNANSAANKVEVDESFGSTILDRVVLTTAEVVGFQEINSKGFNILQVTEKDYPVTISNEKADFGDGDHHFGVPDLPANVTFRRNGDGTITGFVNGTLYWDALWGEGCARLVIEYRNINAVAINIDTTIHCGPGGNANDQENQASIFNHNFTRGDIFSIKLKVDDLDIAGDTQTDIFGFAGHVGF